LSDPFHIVPNTSIFICFVRFPKKIFSQKNLKEKKKMDHVKHSIKFNQDNSCLSIANEQGFQIFHCLPFFKTCDRKVQHGFKDVTMLYRTNILALVGTSSCVNNAFPQNVIKIWDDKQEKSIGELRFRSQVIKVCLSRQRIIVVLPSRIYVYNLSDLVVKDQFDTAPNDEFGLIAFANELNNMVLACPGLLDGHLRIQSYQDPICNHVIAAHEHPLAAIALNNNGTLVATASRLGTIIRIFDTFSGNKMQEVRRGMDASVIYGLSLYQENWLAASTCKGTIHIWKIDQNKLNAKPAKPNEETPVTDQKTEALATAVQNPKSSLYFLSSFLPHYFSSEWSASKIYLSESGIQSTLAFVNETTLCIAYENGHIYLVDWQAKDQEYNIRSYIAS
jgi:WD40 repeat protein